MKFLLVFLLASASFATSLTGSLKGPDGVGVTGYLYLSLSQQAALATTGGCGGPVEVVPNVQVAVQFIAGVIQGSPSVYGNDCLLPSGTWYNAVVKDRNGNVLLTDRWQLTGASVDIGTIVSMVITGTLTSFGAPGVVLTAPLATQTVTQPGGTLTKFSDLQAITQFVLPNGTICTASGCTGGLSFSSAATFTGGINTGAASNSSIYIGSSGNFYLRPFTGADANCSGVANVWIGVRTDTKELQLCIGGALWKSTLH